MQYVEQIMILPASPCRPWRWSNS